MLARVIAHAITAIRNKLIEIFDKVILEFRVLRVDIRESAHLASRTLQAVAPVGN